MPGGGDYEIIDLYVHIYMLRGIFRDRRMGTGNEMLLNAYRQMVFPKTTKIVIVRKPIRFFITVVYKCIGIQTSYKVTLSSKGLICEYRRNIG